MQNFYEQVIGLEVLNRFEEAVFFKIAEGYGGHVQVVVLFDRSKEPGYSGVDAVKLTVDRITLKINRMDFEEKKKRLEGKGIELTTSEHPWVRWKFLYFKDPEGNQVEFVCYDPKV